ncbi:MAG: DUF6259 domain-containing protein, partial [Myxococcota bacterium]
MTVRFPMVTIDYSNSGAARGELVIPRGNLGLKCGDCNGFGAFYPNIYQTMPWFGALNGDDGLYLGAHDPNGAMKRIVTVGPSGKGPSYFEIYPEWSGKPRNSVDPDWYFEIAPLCAKRGWPALAHEYKEWVLGSTPWGAAPLLKDRSDIPKSIRDGAWWVNYSIPRLAGVEVLSDRSRNFKADFRGIPTVHHWYEWHEPGMDRGAPVHTPKHGTREAIREVQADPLATVLLYSNVTHSDQSAAPLSAGRPVHCEGGVSQYPSYWSQTNRRADGTRVFLAPNSKACLASMDLSSHEWQAVALKTADLVTDQLGARGVYLDVVGNVQEGSWSVAGHHPGRGRWVTSASRNLVSSIAKRPQLTVVEGALEQMSGISDAGVNYFATSE